MQSRGDNTVFARTQIAKYLVSLLLCNIVQSVGGLLNIAWLVEKSIYVGVTCTAQAALKQIGNVREPFSLTRREWVLTPLMVSDWSSDFHSCNRCPYLLPTFSVSKVVESHLPYRPHHLMGLPLIRLVHRKFCHRQTRERTSLCNHSQRLLVLDLATVPDGTIYLRLLLHAPRHCFLPHPLLARLFPTPRQHQRLGIQNVPSSTARCQDWQNE